MQAWGTADSVAATKTESRHSVSVVIMKLSPIIRIRL
jgi:hypothetical protein